MLNLSKPILIILLSGFLTACGYQSSNSKKYPHKHIQVLSPKVQDIEMTWINKEHYGQYSFDFNDQDMFYNCSNKNDSLCVYNFQNKTIQKFTLPEAKLDLIYDSLNIQDIQFIDPHNVMIIQTDHAHTQKNVYLFNTQTQQFQQSDIFDHREFTQNVIHLLVQQGIYQIDNTDGHVSYHSSQVVEDVNVTAASTAIEDFKITDINLQDLKEIWLCLKNIFSFSIELPSNGLAHGDFYISPTDQFDDRFKLEFSRYLEAHQVRCFFDVDGHGNLLLQTTHRAIFIPYFIEKGLFQEFWKIPSCGEIKQISPVTTQYLKYTSIDKVKSSGNHFMFWFDPIGFDVFEIEQNDNTKQFKMPINEAILYKINNEIIVVGDQKIYIIHN
ncbi:hypothetical protein [Acinetobacter shaoyimingii]|uniref:Lipoprotein n=1 Tax=Acinetobacter shaoyimingii TaxID=2715164 RepID=A0A6G8RWY7_9GAMM|nr:hypothetical protein [Acinetobacter shaoyimingii]QIO06318.1 hypothetical protein G8E00_10320 [Acinetobacter shaoyimingii]